MQFFSLASLVLNSAQQVVSTQWTLLNQELTEAAFQFRSDICSGFILQWIITLALHPQMPDKPPFRNTVYKQVHNFKHWGASGVAWDLSTGILTVAAYAQIMTPGILWHSLHCPAYTWASTIYTWRQEVRTGWSLETSLRNWRSRFTVLLCTLSGLVNAYAPLHQRGVLCSFVWRGVTGLWSQCFTPFAVWACWYIRGIQEMRHLCDKGQSTGVPGANFFRGRLCAAKIAQCLWAQLVLYSHPGEGKGGSQSVHVLCFLRVPWWERQWSVKEW